MMNSYKDASEHAAALERSKMYLAAAKEWTSAERLAISEGMAGNALWARARADWCENGREEWKFGDCE